jgi:hypothetical protein
VANSIPSKAEERSWGCQYLPYSGGGETHETLLTTVDRELQHPVPRDQPHRQVHVRARADDGMVIVDLWDSEEHFQAMMNDPEFQKNLQEAGTPDPDVIEVFEVHATIP